MTSKHLVEYLKEAISKYPNLKSEIIDLYELCKSEIEEGGSPDHERNLCMQSVKDLINENQNK